MRIKLLGEATVIITDVYLMSIRFISRLGLRIYVTRIMHIH